MAVVEQIKTVGWVYEGQVAGSTHGHPCRGRLRALDEMRIASTEQGVNVRCEKCGAEMQQIARDFKLHSGPEDPQIKNHALVVYQPRAVAQVSKEEVAAAMPNYAVVWPKDLTIEQRVAITRLALAYQLDPLADELVVLGGKPYVTVKGRIRVAERYRDYKGFTPQWLGPDDPEWKLLQLKPEDLAIKVTVRIEGRDPVVAYGVLSMEERMAKSNSGAGYAHPIAHAHPQDVCYKRGVERALRYAKPIPLPGVEGSRYEADYYREGRVNTETGKVITAEDGIPVESVAGSTADQRKLIHILLNELGIPDEDYYAELKKLYGVDSSKKLNASQASEYIDALKRRERRHERGSPMAEEIAAEDEADEPPEERLL